MMPLSLGNKPEIWADGIHDDTFGLGALIRGEPVILPTDKITIDGHSGITFHNGIYRISQTIDVPESARLEIQRPEFLGIELEDYQPFFNIGPVHHKQFIAPVESGDFRRGDGTGKIRIVSYAERDLDANYSDSDYWREIVDTRGILRLRAA